MVISHVHKYVFVELPRTGTTSIADALLEHCDGVRLLHKHAAYNEFVNTASPAEKKYFVFSCIRNPLDLAISDYFKHKTRYKKFLGRINEAKLLTRLVNAYRLRRINSAADPDTDFSSYFLRHYKLPYDNWSAVSHGYCDFVIRFEHLEEDFAKALKLIGIQEEIGLPRANKTSARQDAFLSLYNAEAIKRAKYVFGPFMKKWGYHFPAEWGESAVSWQAQKEYELVNVFRKLCWVHLKPFAARWARLENN